MLAISSQMLALTSLGPWVVHINATTAMLVSVMPTPGKGFRSTWECQLADQMFKTK